MYGKSTYQCKHIDMTGLKMRFGASVSLEDDGEDDLLWWWTAKEKWFLTGWFVLRHSFGPFEADAVYDGIWVNFITSSRRERSLEIIVSKGKYPQMAQQFRLVNYYNLPRWYCLWSNPTNLGPCATRWLACLEGHQPMFKDSRYDALREK